MRQRNRSPENVDTCLSVSLNVFCNLEACQDWLRVENKKVSTHPKETGIKSIMTDPHVSVNISHPPHRYATNVDKLRTQSTLLTAELEANFPLTESYSSFSKMEVTHKSQNFYEWSVKTTFLWHYFRLTNCLNSSHWYTFMTMQTPPSNKHIILFIDTKTPHDFESVFFLNMKITLNLFCTQNTINKTFQKSNSDF